MTIELAASCKEDLIFQRLKSKLDDLRSFRGALDSSVFDPQSDELFAGCVDDALSRFGVKASEFSKEFGVHTSTAGRWAKGKNFPHQMVRPIIMSWLSQRLLADETQLAEEVAKAKERLSKVATAAN